MNLIRTNALTLIVCLACVSACDDDKSDDDSKRDTTGDNSPGTDTDEGAPPDDSDDESTGDTMDDPPDEEPFWVVGDDGVMLRVETDGSAVPYPADLPGDLLDIACQGEARAWVVGSGGALLRTIDGGTHWDVVPSPVAGDLRAVAVSAADVVYAVGDAGALLRSTDAGESWVAEAAPARDFTDVATKGSGATALASASDGTVWRYEDGAAVETFAATQPVYGIAVASQSPLAVVVGAQGLLAHSSDDGHTWEVVEDVTDVDLHDVYAASDGEIMAVGDDGVVVRVVGNDVEVFTIGSNAIDLYAVHLTADGRGNAVGAQGAIFETGDGGESWIRLDSGVQQTLRGVDAIGHYHR